MQERTDTLTVEAIAAYATWSDARLLLTALRELPFTAQADFDEMLAKQKLPSIAQLTVTDAERHFDALWQTLANRLTFWRNDLMQRVHDEICIARDYCANRNSQDFSFWSDLIIILAGILGDLGILALSLLLARRLLDQLCACT